MSEYQQSMTPELSGALSRAAMPDFSRWQEMVAATGGCSNPVRLQGERTTFDTTTGEVLDSYRTTDEPTGYLLTACGNRRASRCPSCAETYKEDTYHLIASGMRGGKGVSATVASHPRVFATLTAPSFGPVHARRERDSRALPCRPRRSDGACDHGQPESCRVPHAPGDCRIGQPLCMDCYDYVGAVLWNANASELWRRFTVYLRRTLAHAAGLSRRKLSNVLRVSYAKVAEFQARGLVHFHTVIRIDGPEGHHDAPPPWVNGEMLSQAVHDAVSSVEVSVPAPEEGSLMLGWGRQVDVRPVVVCDDANDLTDKQVAGYIAKYATKGAEVSGTVDRPLRPHTNLDQYGLSEHARRIIETCWQLGSYQKYAELRLHAWAHMLGFRGHFSTKSRQYSTTLGALRQARVDHRAAEARERDGRPSPEGRHTASIGAWQYAGSGYTPGEALLAEGIRERVQTSRHMAAQARAGNES